MKPIPKTSLKQRVALSILHGVWLIAFSWLWFNFGWLQPEEKKLIQLSSVFNQMILDKASDRPQKGKLFFVNTAKDLTLKPVGDNDGQEVITDRRLLAEFLQFLNEHPSYYRYVICDINLADANTADLEADSLLRAVLIKMKRLVRPGTLSDDTAKKADVFPTGKRGYAYYKTTKGDFFRFKLMQNNQHKSVPLLMYEELYQQKMQKSGLFYYVDNQFAFNQQIIDFKIRNKHFTDPQYYGGAYTLTALSELNMIGMLDTTFLAMGKPIVVIGDFTKYNMHETVLTPTSGAIILLNAYLRLEAGEHLINPWLIVLLLVAFSLLSYSVFYGIAFPAPLLWLQFISTPPGKLVRNYLGLALFLTVLTLICYQLFHVHLNILIIAVYIKLIENTKLHLKKVKAKREEKRAVENLLPRMVAKQKKIQEDKAARAEKEAVLAAAKLTTEGISTVKSNKEE